jgi:protein-disulfide isomerase
LAAREEAERVKAGVMAVRNDDGDPVMGNPNGSLTVYEFSDYNCGYCKRMFAPIMQMLAKNGDVRMVIKEFPILSQSSVTAAKAGIAAQKQGKFKSFHTEMMTYRGQINDASIMQAAGAAGLDLAQLKQDMDSPETTAIIGRTRSAAAALNINGTPGLVIGDTVIPGAISIEELQTVIDKERSKQG